MIVSPLVRFLRRRPGRAFVAAVTMTCALAGVGNVAARPSVPTSTDEIAVSALSREGRETLAAIRAGGPFASKRDGIPFGNREGLLPKQRRGYYAEYTVPTPGARTRGARRIIAGLGRSGDFRTSDEYYYTNDHYQSFRRIVQ